MVERTASDKNASRGLIDLRLPVKLPLVAIGAPVGSYYPEIAERLGTALVIPPHAAVCNAVGAVAGGVSKRVDALVIQPFEGCFRVHLPTGNRDHTSLDAAAEHAGQEAKALALAAASAAGADSPEVSISREDITAEGVGGMRLFIEARISATAFGRPRLGID
jgi:N-methylhydantoinase A/oxoprolinase/acetone carboxylase beta subunit